jgi:hypothetical protein
LFQRLFILPPLPLCLPVDIAKPASAFDQGSYLLYFLSSTRHRVLIGPVNNSKVFVRSLDHDNQPARYKMAETAGPDALKKIKEREELEELTQLLAGAEEDYVS